MTTTLWNKLNHLNENKKSQSPISNSQILSFKDTCIVMRFFIKVGIVAVIIGCGLVLSALGLEKLSIQNEKNYSEIDFERQSNYYSSKEFNLTEGEIVKIIWISNETLDISIAIKEKDNFTKLKSISSKNGYLEYNVERTEKYFIVAETNLSLRISISVIVVSYPYEDRIFPVIVAGLFMVALGISLIIYGFYKEKDKY